MEDPRLTQIAEYQMAIIDCKKNSEYQSLMSKHRGPLDQKLLDRHRLKITSLQAKIKAIEDAMLAERPKQISNKHKELRHPVNPALHRLATAKIPDGPKNNHFKISRGKMVVDRTEHEKIVNSQQLDNFLEGRPTENVKPVSASVDLIQVENEVFDFDNFDDMENFDEPLPDFL